MQDTNSDDRVYAFGYSPAAVGLMESRSAEVNAAFLLPKLADDMSVLDIGCGPGSITTGLADRVRSGRAVGLDIEASQIQIARERAQSAGLRNCEFDVGSVLDLPYPDSSFDVVFGHTILMQFADPNPVFNEVKRVLRPGGIIAFRELDFAASLFGPAGSAIEAVWSTLRRSILDNDGFPDIGRHLPRLVSEAGFQVEWARPEYVNASTPEARKAMYGAMAALWQQAGFVGDAVEAGWLTDDERAQVLSRLDVEAGDMRVLSSTTYVEVLARYSAD